MRIANIAGRLVLVTGGGAVDVATASNGQFAADAQQIFDRWDEFRDWAETNPQPDAAPDPAAHVDPPVPRPRQVFGIGLNYRAHAAESNLAEPAFPATFTKFPTSLTGAFDDIELPSATVDWEVELVVVIGRRAFKVKEREGWAYVAGLTVGQDISERTVQLRPPVPQFSLGKSFPGFSPIGPQLVTPDELSDPDDLEIGCSLDGEQVQKSRTSQLIFPVPTLIEKLSSICPLLPGDLIFSGTPSGVGGARTPARYLHPGQLLESTITGIGTMRHHLVQTDDSAA
jgi:2,4-diketo-3-deoxy-L-fuconate hydrolase